MSTTYKEAGVNIEAGEETVERIKPIVKSTHNKNVMSNIGLFGGFYNANFEGIKEPILVSSVDGVGTKLKLAFMTGIHNTVGQDLVNHSVGDILCCGAKPLFFLDYYAGANLIPDITVSVIEGFAKACKENDTALIGGETAEMPGMYHDGEYDMSGTIVGVVDKKNVINGEKIKKGDVMIGLPSTGLHTNGYSLARYVLFPKFKHNQYLEELGSTVAEALMAVHKSYLKTVYPLVEKRVLSGISHITGGGIEGNTSRILQEGQGMDIDWNSWNNLPIFELIQKEGNISDEEMRRAFNLGIGMILICPKENVDMVLGQCREDNAVVMGSIT